jgi:WD40 repeat protein
MVGAIESGLDKVGRIAWSADGRWLAAAWPSQGTRLWSTPDATPARQFDSPWFAWSPKGQKLAIGARDAQVNELTIWDLERGQSRKIYHKSLSARSEYPVWSPDGTRVASGFRHRRTGGIWIWPINGQAAELEFQHTHQSVGPLAIDWSQDSRQLVSVGLDAAVRVFDAHTGEPIWLAVALANGETISLTAAGEPLDASGGARTALVYMLEKPDGTIAELTADEFDQRVTESH